MFLICIDNNVTHLIEVKTSDDEPSKHLISFGQLFPNAKKIQLVKNLAREKTYPNGIEIRDLVNWLTHFNL